MLRGFNAEIQRLVTLTVACTAFGLLIGQLAWTLIAGGALYMGWMLWQIRQLEQWLDNSDKSLPPDASGIWGDIFDSIFRLQTKQEREKRRLHAVINRVQDTTGALRDGVILIDDKGNIDWWNKAAQRLLGLQVNDQGHPLMNYIRHPKFIRYYEKGKYEKPLDLPSPRFSNKHLQYQVTRFGQNERLVVVRDITQLHYLEKMRQDFVANVSHELRTPLTVIRGYIETFCDSPELPSKWVKACDQMHQQTSRMSLLINDLITLSKLETAVTDRNQKTVNISRLLHNIKNEAMALNGDKQHTISLNCPTELYILGNEKELHSAFSNLVTNAVKYSPEGSQIHMLAELSDAGFEFSVKDNGQGFDRKHIPRLTERFYRIDASRNSKTGGTGLGLAIVKHVLLRHDAKLHIDSDIGKGSTFTCQFPASYIAEPAKAIG